MIQFDYFFQMGWKHQLVVNGGDALMGTACPNGPL